MLSINNVSLLTAMYNKANCEKNLSLNSSHKLALTRERTALAQEKNMKLQAKNISYYDNGKYNKISYGYLMGYGANYTAITSGTKPLKEHNSIILTDFKGQVVLSADYAKAITSVLGSSAMNAQGRGGTFSTDYIPAMLANLIPGYSEEQFKAVINGDGLTTSYEANIFNLSTQEVTGTTTVDNSDTSTKLLQSIVDFYLPIFSAAAANGWTTEYNDEINLNPDYINDAIVSGLFQLATVDSEGNYEPDTSLTYYLTTELEENLSSEDRARIEAWYNAEMERLTEKESLLDLSNNDLSLQLEALNAEIESLQGMLKDSYSAFEFGNA